MGLTAMEAMACGVVVIGPKNGGLNEIIDDELNGILVDTSNEVEIYDAASRLIKDHKYLNKIKMNACDVLRYSPEISAEKILQHLFDNKEKKVIEGNVQSLEVVHE